MNNVTDYATTPNIIEVLLDDGDNYTEYPLEELLNWAKENKLVGDDVACSVWDGDGDDFKTIFRYVDEEEFLRNLNKGQVQEFVNSKS